MITNLTTDSDSWKIVHKYLPPALGPKAVRHYAPKMYVLHAKTATTTCLTDHLLLGTTSAE